MLDAPQVPLKEELFLLEKLNDVPAIVQRIAPIETKDPYIQEMQLRYLWKSRTKKKRKELLEKLQKSNANTRRVYLEKACLAELLRRDDPSFERMFSLELLLRLRLPVSSKVYLQLLQSPHEEERRLAYSFAKTYPLQEAEKMLLRNVETETKQEMQALCLLSLWSINKEAFFAKSATLRDLSAPFVAKLTVQMLQDPFLSEEKMFPLIKSCESTLQKKLAIQLCFAAKDKEKIFKHLRVEGALDILSTLYFPLYFPGKSLQTESFSSKLHQLCVHAVRGEAEPILKEVLQGAEGGVNYGSFLLSYCVPKQGKFLFSALKKESTKKKYFVVKKLLETEQLTKPIEGVLEEMILEPQSYTLAREEGMEYLVEVPESEGLFWKLHLISLLFSRNEEKAKELFKTVYAEYKKNLSQEEQAQVALQVYEDFPMFQDAYPQVCTKENFFSQDLFIQQLFLLNLVEKQKKEDEDFLQKLLFSDKWVHAKLSAFVLLSQIDAFLNENEQT